MLDIWLETIKKNGTLEQQSSHQQNIKEIKGVLPLDGMTKSKSLWDLLDANCKQQEGLEKGDRDLCPTVGRVGGGLPEKLLDANKNSL
ncbi:hypothetical protein V9T40_002429 [Parthenolecanium corni]|uniref:Uncharacterized protein n=1 Tax=Parthenolecanium corni TaxID=536013 RepID=A0AAN9TIG6_9HEMI